MTPHTSDYIPISVCTILPGAVVDMELFQLERGRNRFVLYRGSGVEIQPTDLQRLRERGIHHLYIRKLAQSTYQDYLRKILSADAGAGSLAARVDALQELIRDVLQSAFSRRDTDASVQAASELGHQAADIICHDEFASSDLFRVLHHDYGTFTHSANVALYCAMLANEMGLDKHDVALIAAGGLIHDLGKLQISEKILNKPGRLTDLEFREVKKHPITGFSQLAHRNDLTEGQLMMVYQHHERCNHRGYPVGVGANEIHLWAKICSVVDVFEALTSDRPYRNPLPKPQVFQLMDREQDGYDREIFECWKKITESFWTD